MLRRIIHGDALAILPTLPAGCAQLVYVDPPFNTGHTQKRARIKASKDAEAGTRTGFGGAKYVTTTVSSSSYADQFDDYLGFLMPRLEAAVRCLSSTGSLFVHLDFREVHYVKVALDQMLGRASFMNEIIWAYDYGARSRSRWSSKHDSILWYARDPKHYIFNYESIDRIPYMAPDLVGPEKAARGKTPTDVWWNTIVPTNSRERTGYATQKPLAIVRRIVRVHSAPGDVVLDCFAGSGTTGEAAAIEGRNFIMIDESEEAIAVMRKRLAPYQ